MDMNEQAKISAEMDCFECGGGKIYIHYLPYKTTGGSGEVFVVDNVPTHICDKCGSTMFSSKASRMIEDARIKAGVKYRTFTRSKP